MHPALRAPYALLGAVAEAATAIAGAGNTKLTASFAGRRGLRERLAAWGATHRDASRPLVWFHAPSVGEGLQARPVIQRLRLLRHDAQVAYTHFSPSARRFAQNVDADFADFLPFDTVGGARAALDALRPTALIFSKLDLWPVLVEEAARRGVRLGLIAGTVTEGSGRRGGLAGALLRDAYRALDRVGAIDAANADRLIALGVRADCIEVTGDTRYDQVHQRALGVQRSSPLLAPFTDGRPTLVAGSTWPGDEMALEAAWRSVRNALPQARLIIAPHEPTPPHLLPIDQWIARERLHGARLGDASAAQADVVVVDRVGVLGDLYGIADVAYVGGGFHSAGLHSVLEPAAFGAPVVFGPQHTSSRDAQLLIDASAGASVSDAAALAEQLTTWLGDTTARAQAGARARAMVESGLGAAERSSALVLQLLG